MGEAKGAPRSTFESASFKVAERDYRILVDSIADYAIFMLGPDGRIETWNAGAQALHGYAADEIIGERLGLLFVEDDRAAGADGRQLERAKTDGRAEDEGWRARKDGTRFWASSVLTALWDGRRLLGFAEVTRDLSAKRKAEETRDAALARAEALLGESRRMESVGRLAAAVAHDFNNVLSVILTYCDLLVGELGASAGPVEDVEEIRTAATRAARMTRQLIAYSKRNAVSRETLDLCEVVRATEGIVRKTAGPQVTVVLDLTAPAVAVADRVSLEQGLVILAANAGEAMPNGGTLTIRTSVEAGEDERRGAWAVLRVTDTGVGMNEATQVRCFEPFFTTKTAEGAGMGLAILQGAVRQSGGSVRLESAPGRGTTVAIYLPAGP